MDSTALPKIALFPKGYMEALANGTMNLFDWIQEAGELGAQGIEMYPLFLRNHDEEYLYEIKAACEEYKIEIPMMCSSPDFTHPDQNFREKEIAKLKEMIDVMTVLGPEEFRSCRVLSGQRRPEVTREEGIQYTVQSIQELLPYAEQKKVHLVLENHYKDGFWIYPEFAQMSDVFLEIADQISSPWFGINYDPSNALVAGEDHIKLLEQLKGRVITMHASDRHLKEEISLEELHQQPLEGYPKALIHGVIGEGLIDYDAIFQILYSIHFSGWISIEDGINGTEDLRKSLSFLTGKRKQYFM